MPSRPGICNLIMLVLAGAMITACTPYKQLGLMGGVDDLQVSATTYRIFARGNGFTSPERVHDFVLLRASQIAILHGYEGFVIDDNEDETESMTSVYPGSVTTVAFPAPYSAAGVSMPGPVSTIVTPPIISTVVKPAFMTFVTLVGAGGLNAGMIFDRLAPRYGVSSVTETIPARDIPQSYAAKVASKKIDKLQRSGTVSRSSDLGRVGLAAQWPQPARRPFGIIAESLRPGPPMTDRGGSVGGLLILGVQPGSAAARAGLRRDDILLDFSGAAIRSESDIEAALRPVLPGNVIIATILRNDEKLTVRLRF